MFHWLRVLETWLVFSLVPVSSTSPDLLLVPRDEPASTIPLRLWANPRQAVFRPRKRDLHQASLMASLQPHFDSEWMSLTKPHRPPPALLEERRSIADLNKLAAPLPLSETVRDWLVTRASCPVRYEWSDLGNDFWPRWVRIAVCLRPALGTCSWPPGMSCVPGPPRHLHVLRWHCRLRKNSKRKKTSENNVWGNGDIKDAVKKKKKKGKRRRYRCLWVKVPYPVPEDCVCACS